MECNCCWMVLPEQGFSLIFSSKTYTCYHYLLHDTSRNLIQILMMMMKMVIFSYRMNE